MKNIKNRFMHLIYFSLICVLTVFAAGCGDEEETADRHVPGAYTGSYNSSSITIVVGDNDITRLTITVYNSTLGSVETIDKTGSWPLTWNDDDYCYDFLITESTDSGLTVTVDGVAGINVDGIPTVQGSVLIEDTYAGTFYLYL